MRSTDLLRASGLSSATAWLASGCAGAVAGFVDLFAACAINGAYPIRIMQTIAGGLLGAKTFMTPYSAALGLGLQIGMGALIAFGFLLVRGPIGARLNRPMLAIGGGIITFLVMNYVVLPLSAWRRVPHFSIERGLLNLLAMLVFAMIVIYGTDAMRAQLTKQKTT